MTQSSRTFRIFVSSTFNDLKEERNALQKYVFPRLRELAMAHGCRFQAIDLRWGVSQEAGLDQQTMKICLTEIERCQKVSPRPNFVILLGDRFGWRPLPYAIPAAEFERLLPLVTDEERQQLLWREDQALAAKGWYRRDDNAAPAEYVLQARLRGTRFEEYAAWESEVEFPLVAALERAALKAGLEDQAKAKYSLSATGQEIMDGALRVSDASEHVFGFFRSITNPGEALASGSGQAFIEPDPDLQQRQQALKARLLERLPGNIYTCTAGWQAGSLSTNHIGSIPGILADCLKLNESGNPPLNLCEAIWLRLSGMILAETGRLEAVDGLEREQAAHLAFGLERSRLFTGRKELLSQITGYLSGSDTRPLVIWGESGSGKSALIARAAEQVHATFGDQAVLMVRFIGATPESSNGLALLESLCRQITRAYRGDESTLPLEYRLLTQEFSKRMALANPAKPLVIFLDALDQLSASDNARALAWLPAALPPHVKLVVSSLPDDCLEVLSRRRPAPALLQVTPMSQADGESLLQHWLGLAQRTLTPAQHADLMAKFEDSGGLPLYLKLGFEEARRWHAYDGLPLLSGQAAGLPKGVPGVIRNLFWRLEQENNHGRLLVAHALGCLAAAKNGLSEDELLDIFWQDEQVRADFFRRSPKSPPAIDGLPVVIWARLYLDLEPYLAIRKADGAELIGFYHRQVTEVAQADYGSPSHHARLAAYFTPQPLYLDLNALALNLHKLSEMVYQQACAGLASQVEKALLDYAYLQARFLGQGVQELIGDYTLVSQAGVEPEKAKTLALLQGGLRMSAHLVGQDPAQLPGQLTGRLLHYTEADLQRLCQQMPGEVRHFWLRPELACLNAPGGPLQYTLAEHTEPVKNVVLAPDGKTIVSASDDNSIKTWDLATGVCLRTLKFIPFGAPCPSLALSPDGQLAIFPSIGQFEDKLGVWNLDTGECLKTLEKEDNRLVHRYNVTAISADGRRAATVFFIRGFNSDSVKVWNLETLKKIKWLNTGPIENNCLALSANGKRVVTASANDFTLKVWNIAGAECLQTMKGHTNHVNSMVISADIRFVISASDDQTIKVWDFNSGECLRTLTGHTGPVKAVALSASGVFIASASEDKTVRVWRFDTGKCLSVLTGHSGSVNAVALSANGLQVASASKDATLIVWELTHSLPPFIQAPHTNYVACVAVSTGGRRAVSASHDNTLKVWDLKNNTCLRTLGGHTQAVNGVAVTPDGRQAVSGAGDHTLRVWDLRSGACLHILNGHTGKVNGVALSPNGQQVISASEDKTLKIWNLETGACLHTLEGHEKAVNAVAVTPDGKQAISGSHDQLLKVWDIQSGACLQTLPGHRVFLDGPRYVFDVKISADGKLAVSAAKDFTLKVWELATGKCLRTLEGHQSAVTGVALSPDGQFAVSTSWDKTIKVWNLASGVCVHTFEGDGASMLCCACSADGLTLLAGDANGILYFFNLENSQFAPPVVTAWLRAEAAVWQFWQKKLAFGCPHCRTWPEIPPTALGRQLACPNCGQPVTLNPFTIHGEWQSLERAWKEDNP